MPHGDAVRFQRLAIEQSFTDDRRPIQHFRDHSYRWSAYNVKREFKTYSGLCDPTNGQLTPS